MAKEQTKKSMEEQPKKNGMKITMGIALALILFGLVNLGVYTFYPSPDYSDFCDFDVRTPLKNLNGTAEDPYDNSCFDDYDLARDAYNQVVFYVFLVLGLALSVVGLFITHVSFQITGIGAGTVLIMEGIMRNLQDKIPAFLAGILVFLILAYVVWKRIK